MSGEPSHLHGVVKQHEAQIKNPDVSHEQREASKDAISRLKAGEVDERELGSNTPTPEERAARDKTADTAAEVANSAVKALPEDGERP